MDVLLLQSSCVPLRNVRQFTARVDVGSLPSEDWKLQSCQDTRIIKFEIYRHLCLAKSTLSCSGESSPLYCRNDKYRQVSGSIDKFLDFQLRDNWFGSDYFLDVAG